jgi:hypothetical protein
VHRLETVLTVSRQATDSIIRFLKLQVDKVVHSASGVYEKNSNYLNQQLDHGRQIHAKNMEAYKAAREQYVNKVTESLEFVKKNGLNGAAKRAADEVSSALEEAKKLPNTVMKQLHDAWERLVAFEPVQKTLGAARPAVEAAWSRYEAVHDNVVASSYYKMAYDRAQAALSAAQSTVLYQKAMQNVYAPFFAKYADPAIGQVTAHPYYQTLVAQLEPKA